MKPRKDTVTLFFEDRTSEEKIFIGLSEDWLRRHEDIKNQVIGTKGLCRIEYRGKTLWEKNNAQSEGLVPGPVPIDARLSCIEAGEEVIR